MSAKVDKNGFMFLLWTDQNNTGPGRVGARAD